MDFKECRKKDDFLHFYENEEQALRHTFFYHYTSLENVNKILKSKTFRLTPLSKSANDLVEKENYKKFGSNIFSLCFSTGTSESLPLWYLYSGINGSGARIGLRKKSFRKITNELDVSLLEVEPQEPFEAIGDPIKLNNKDFKFKCRDIMYIGPDTQKENVYRIKHNGRVANDIEKDIADNLISDYKRFTKGLIWFYEKETRLQVEVTNNKLMNPEKSYVVMLNIANILEDVSVRLAPEYEDKIEDIFEKNEGLKEWAFLKLEKSDYAGQLKMDLEKKL